MESIDWYSWVGLPLLIFASRIVDVTLGTMRIIFTSRGRRQQAALLGFAEVLIWIVVVSRVFSGEHSPTAYVGYAAGFATGTFVGMLVEERMAIGTLMVRIILSKGADELIEQLRAAGFGVTTVHGEGGQGPVCLIYTIVKRRNLPHIRKLIHDTAPGTFFSVEEVRSSEMGIFPDTEPRHAAKDKIA
jgi:uncharacterized protein YebE (UPF0316 family)